MRWDKKSVLWTLALIIAIIAVNFVTIWKYIDLRSGGATAGAVDFPCPDRITVTSGIQNKTIEKDEKAFDALWQTCRKTCRSVDHVSLLNAAREDARITVRFEYNRPKKGFVILQRERRTVTTEKIVFVLTGEQFGTVWIDGAGYGGLMADPDGIQYAEDLFS